jgi:MFS family permease
MSLAGEAKKSDPSSVGSASEPARSKKALDIKKNLSLRNSWTSLFLGLAVPLLSLSPLLTLALRDLWTQLPYRFFPASIGLGMLFLATSRSGYLPASVTRQRIGMVITLLGFGLSLWAIFTVAANRSLMAAVMIVTGWSIRSFGGVAWTRMIAICGLFACIVPLPRGLGTMLMSQLQFLAGWCTSSFLEFWSIPNVFENNVLRIAGQQMATWEVCGDASSCIALVAFALAWCIFQRRSAIVTTATLFTSLFFSMFGDFLRLILIAWLSQGMSLDATRGWYGISVGIFIFLLNVLLVVVCSTSITALLGPVVLDQGSRFVSKAYQRMVTWPASIAVPSSQTDRKEANDATAPSAIQEGTKSLDWLLWVPCSLILLGGGLCLWVLFLNPKSRENSLQMSLVQASALPGKDSLPSEFGTLKRINYSEETRTLATWLGQYSHMWQYDNGETQVVIHLDFPLPTWNVPSQMYSMLGTTANGEGRV